MSMSNSMPREGSRSRNQVRKSLSRIKGGRLALAAAPARVVTYVISDVPGDDPANIGSGPSIPEPQDVDAVFTILNRYGIGISPAMKDAIIGNCELPIGTVGLSLIHI